jgi:hypothetical protein
MVVILFWNQSPKHGSADEIGELFTLKFVGNVKDVTRVLVFEA